MEQTHIHTNSESTLDVALIEMGDGLNGFHPKKKKKGILCYEKEPIKAQNYHTSHSFCSSF